MTSDTRNNKNHKALSATLPTTATEKQKVTSMQRPHARLQNVYSEGGGGGGASGSTQAVRVRPTSPPPPAIRTGSFYKRATDRLRHKSGNDVKTNADSSVKIRVSVTKSASTDNEPALVKAKECISVRVDDAHGHSANGALEKPRNATPDQAVSPGKKVTFMERTQKAYSLHGREDQTEEAKEKGLPPLRHHHHPVRKSQTLDTVPIAVNTNGDSGKQATQSSPKNQVMEFFSQKIRSPTSAFRASFMTKENQQQQPSSNPRHAPVERSASAGRPRSFTLGWRNLGSFRNPTDERKRDAETKSGRKKFRSSFRVSWLQTAKPKDDQFLQPSITPKPIIRKRSISDANLHRYVLRQTSSDPDLVKLNLQTGNAYQELLANFNCYDLMCQQNLVIGIDCRHTARQALQAMARNDVRVAVLWNSESWSSTNVLTGTDFLRILASHFFASEKNEAQCQCGEQVFEKPLQTTIYECEHSKKTRKSIVSVGCQKSLRTALTLLIENRFHRLPVINARTNDILYFLTKKTVLHYLAKKAALLPNSTIAMDKLIDSKIGTWHQIEDENQTCAFFTLLDQDTLSVAAEKFLSTGVSALPVVEGQTMRLLDALTKVDILNFLIINNCSVKNGTVGDVLRVRHQGAERMTTCHFENTLSDAIQIFRRSGAHRLFIVDDENLLKGVISISDVLSHLIA